jgi:hypothetical protein
MGYSGDGYTSLFNCTSVSCQSVQHSLDPAGIPLACANDIMLGLDVNKEQFRARGGMEEGLAISHLLSKKAVPRRKAGTVAPAGAISHTNS